MFCYRDEPKKDDKPKVSYSIFSYLESSVHDKESFTKEQTKFSGSKSLSIETVIKPKEITEKKIYIEPQTSINTGFTKRMTVAELFLKESEKDLKNNEKSVVTETINKFDKMDLYKSIFLSDSENEEVNESNTTDVNDFMEKPKNVERNTSPPRGIFANIDFDELNSWKRNTDKTNETKINNETKSKDKTTDNEEIKNIPETNEDANVYGPKIPDNLKKHIEDSVIIVNDFKPVYRNKEKRDESSSDSDSWVEAKELKSKKDKKKKSKKHKSKHKKSKHKKKDR